jgi:hypothetical protein
LCYSLRVWHRYSIEIATELLNFMNVQRVAVVAW